MYANQKVRIDAIARIDELHRRSDLIGQTGNVDEYGLRTVRDGYFRGGIWTPTNQGKGIADYNLFDAVKVTLLE